MKSTAVLGASYLTTAQNLGNKDAAFLRGEFYYKKKHVKKAGRAAFLKAWELGYEPIEAYPEDIQNLIKNSEQEQSDELAQQPDMDVDVEIISKKRSLSDSIGSGKDSSNDTDNVKKPRMEINNLSESTDSDKDSSNDTDNVKKSNTEKNNTKSGLHPSIEAMLPKSNKAKSMTIQTNNNMILNSHPELKIAGTTEEQSVAQPQVQIKETIRLDLTVDEAYPMQNYAPINSYHPQYNSSGNGFDYSQPQPFQLTMGDESGLNSSLINQQKFYNKIIEKKDLIIQRKENVIKEKDFFIEEKDYAIKQKDLQIQSLLNRLAVYEKASK